MYPRNADEPMSLPERASRFGRMLGDWRRLRGASQLELALACGVSQRHVSFLETGRSRPSRGMVLHLATVLEVPLDRQNAMLLAAGFAPVYGSRSLDAPEMRPIAGAIEHILDGQEPYPAIVVDRAYRILRANGALGTLVGFLIGAERAEAVAAGPSNAVELVLREDGLRPVLENWREVGTWLIRRLRAEAMLEGGEKEIGDLLDRVLELPDVAGLDRAAPIAEELPPTLALRFRKGDATLSFFSVVATVGTPLDVSLQNLRLELFFPADAATEAWLRRV